MGFNGPRSAPLVAVGGVSDNGGSSLAQPGVCLANICCCFNGRCDVVSVLPLFLGLITCCGGASMVNHCVIPVHAFFPSATLTMVILREFAIISGQSISKPSKDAMNLVLILGIANDHGCKNPYCSITLATSQKIFYSHLALCPLSTRCHLFLGFTPICHG